MADLKI